MTKPLALSTAPGALSFAGAVLQLVIRLELSRLRSLKFKKHRTMIRALDIGQNIRAHNSPPAGRIHEEIINTPADIPLAGIAAITPPGIVAGILIKLPEGVNPTRLGVGIQPLSFFRGKSGVIDIGGWIGQIFFGVSDIEITADHHRFFPGQTLKKSVHGKIKFLF